MKKLNIRNFYKQILFAINVLNSILIAVCCSLYFIYSPSFSSISFLTLLFPVFYVFNLCFFIYWILKLDLRFILSLLIIIIFLYNSLSIYNINNQSSVENGLNIMSFNARLFNRYNWIKNESLITETEDFFKRESPEFIAIQEFHKDYEYIFKDYNYSHIFLSGNSYGKSIFSKNKIIKKGVIAFDNSSSNAIYADIVVKSDTIRVYNAHFESFKFDLYGSKEEISILKMINKYKSTYKLQKEQSDVLINHINNCPFSIVLAVDMNNTQHSFVYRRLKEKLDDSFVISGKGFGSTYRFNFLPFRIDYIFASPSISTNNFKIYKQKLSDHNPISVYLNI